MEKKDNDFIPSTIKLALKGGIQKAVRRHYPFQLIVELNRNCEAGCKYCYSSDPNFKDVVLDTDAALKLIDDARECGVRVIHWFGGNPLLHPDWYKIFSYCSKKRVVNNIMLTGQIPQDDAEKLASIKTSILATQHIDTINPDDYRRLSYRPETLAERIEGCHNLLKAGFPSSQMNGHMIVTKQSYCSHVETINWFKDEIGVQFVSCGTYKDQQFMNALSRFEPGLSEKHKVMEYRDRRFGNYLEIMGTCDIGMVWCKSVAMVYANGDVSPCYYLHDLTVGNVFKQNLSDIINTHRDLLLFNFEINGHCSRCGVDNCFGCRSDAYHYQGDVRASNPKCYMCPDARELYFRKN